jgi:hypothetical protein
VRTHAFGLSLRFEGENPPGAWEERTERGGPELLVREASPEALCAVWSGAESIGWEATIDGMPFRVERGVRADHLFRHGDRPICHLDLAGATLLCGVASADAVTSWRVVLDSVLFSVALLRGLEALHAGAVVGDGGAIAIAAAAGGGKSTLLSALIANGFELLSDDVVALEGEGELVLAHPGPPLMTVPAAIASLPGEELAAVGEERWLATPVCSRARPLTAVVLLSRRAGTGTALLPLATPFTSLLPMMLGFPRTPERERSRFELAATVAAGVPVWELRAEPTVPAGELAELLMAAEPQAGHPATNLRRA